MSQGTLPAGVDLSSPEALARLRGHVQDRVHGRVRELHLRLHEGALILQGRAPTYYAKQLAQHAVMEATAVSRLVNEIEVRVV